MALSFEQLSRDHFSLLLKWLNKSHVKKWWDQDIVYTYEIIEEKYSSYTEGYKLENSIKKPISAFIIYLDDKPIGYIQIYNTYDFMRTKSLKDLPRSLGSVDFFIGEEEYLRRGIGVEILKVFDYQNFEYILVDPDINNIAAIKTYEKAGFKKIVDHTDVNEVWMIKKINK